LGRRLLCFLRLHWRTVEIVRNDKNHCNKQAHQQPDCCEERLQVPDSLRGYALVAYRKPCRSAEPQDSERHHEKHQEKNKVAPRVKPF
jgi:hypothetical protein